MRALRWLVVLGVSGLVACGDDGINRLAPDTELDQVPAALTNETNVSITFRALGNANNFVCSLDGGALVICTPPFETVVGDGEHTFEVSAALNSSIDETPAMHTWRVDTGVPDTMILSGPPAIDNTVMPELVFSGSDPGGGAVTYECALDTTTFTPCTTPMTVSIADGTHAFQVRAVDQAGNVDPTPAQHVWTLDSTAPDTAILTGPVMSSTIGRDTALTFSSPDATATFECSLDGAAFTACTSPQAYTNLADGVHTFSVRAKDEVGIVDPSPPTRTWTVDGTPPPVTITQAPTDPSNDATPTFAFTSTDSTAMFECQIDTAAFAACTSPWTSAALTDGPHTFTVRASDAVGNSSTASHAWTIDTIAPTVTITSGPSGLVTSASAAFAFTTAGSPTTTECSLDGAAFTACTSPASYTGLSDAIHTFTVRVGDAAGNTGMDVRTFTVDTTPPVVTIISGPTGPTADSTPTFGFMVTGATTITCSVDGGAFVACVSPFTTATLADGAHSFTVRGTDAATNSASATRSFSVDTIGPTVTILTAPANPTAATTAAFTFSVTEGTPQCRLDGGAFANCTSGINYTSLAAGSHTFTVQAADTLGNLGSDSHTWTIDTTPPTVTILTTPTNPTASTSATFTFSVSEGSPQCRIDAAAFTSCTSGIMYTSLTPGSHTFTVQATDGVGNTGSDSYTWSIDTTGPTVTITPPPNPTNDNTPTVAFAVSADGINITCQVDTATPVTCAPTMFTTGTLADGSHTITIRATDALGNPGSAATSFVVDTIGPAVVFDAVPPEKWPVNYFSMLFHATETPATFECSLNGAAFTTCASPRAITTTYGITSSFSVRARDGLGNQGPAVTTTWTSSTGVVLHYPWEQGRTHNTSLLEQVPSYSPDGSVTLPVVGGWAGTAAGTSHLGGGVPAHSYPRTIRPLSSSPDATYTGSTWVRVYDDTGSGTLWSTVNGTTGGHRVSMSSTQVVLDVFEGGQLYQVSGFVPFNQWSSIAVQGTGVAKGLTLYINGVAVGTAAAPTGNGFGAGQATNLTVGAITGIVMDDLRFYNTLVNICTVVMRGVVNGQNQCIPLIQGFEYDFEQTFDNYGTFSMQGSLGAGSYVGTPLGSGRQIAVGAAALSLSNFANNVNTAPGHSFSLWFYASDTADTLFSFTRPCSFVANFGTCGIHVFYGTDRRVHIQTATGLAHNVVTDHPTVLASGFHSVVVTEQKSGTTTASVTLYVDGVPVVIPVGTGDVYGIVNDTITLPATSGFIIDEIEFWPRDLSQNAEMLCENGFDGEWQRIAGTCSLTSN